MGGVFISYAREDRATARRLAGEFEQRGWTVWWDFQLVPGEQFRTAITKALNDADCVVVLWSAHSVNSNFVIDEATVGLERHVLVPALINQEVDPPLGFGGVHAADLSEWREGGRHPGLTALVTAVGRHIGGPATVEFPTLAPMPRQAAAGPPSGEEARVRAFRDRDEVATHAGAGIHLLADRYELRGQLGQGQLTEVFEGYDRVLGRPVAIRLPPAYQHVHDPATISRVRTEVLAAASLVHPNVVAIYDASFERDHFYVVMEHVRGPALRAVLDREEAMAPSRAAQIALDVCGALRAAHRAGIIHGDLRPESILVADDGVKVTNFGLPPAPEDLPPDNATLETAIPGDPHYMAPEWAQYGRLDARSDLYALGCCLYEMLTGAPPFDGPSPLAVAYRHVSDDPRPPSRRNPDVPPALDAVTLRALAKDPGRRFRGAEDMAAALGPAVSG